MRGTSQWVTDDRKQPSGSVPGQVGWKNYTLAQNNVSHILNLFQSQASDDGRRSLAK